MDKYRHFEARIKEVGNDHILTPSYSGCVDKAFLIKFWGLDAPDIEWYEINEVTNEE